ncbi:MAG: inositol monophosphatase family protein [Bacteroidota bacterium]
MNYQKICEEVIEVVKETGSFIKKEGARLSVDSVTRKGTNDFVTHVDKSAEEQLVRGLSKILPGSGFIAEEGTVKEKDEQFKWIIDPIDGTTNFIHKLPPFAVSVALMEGDVIVLGVVYEIMLDECFYSYKGANAYCNNKEISVSLTSLLSDSFIATGFPYNYFDKLDPFMDSLTYLFQHTQGVRRLGSAATDLVYVAAGRFDGFYEYNLKPWDVAAGAFIVQQAGGINADFSGGDDYLFGREIVSANHNMFYELHNALKGFLKK